MRRSPARHKETSISRNFPFLHCPRELEWLKMVCICVEQTLEPSWLSVCFVVCVCVCFFLLEATLEPPAVSSLV
jgi:hypothetical protein